MKASIPHLNNGGLGLFDPGLDIVWPGENFDIKNHFELTSFELSDSEVEPFEEVTVSWTITPKNNNINVADYKFILYGPDSAFNFDIALEGSTQVAPLSTSAIYIKGRRNNASLSPLGEPLVLHVNLDNCTTVEIPNSFIDFAVTDSVREIARSEAEIKLRTNDLLESTWTNYSIGYDIPLELIINNFFNADIDLKLTITFNLEHNENNSQLEVKITDQVDADFSTTEDILSLGSTSKLAKLIEKIVPLILDCRLQHAEGAVLRQLLQVPTVAQAINEGKRMLSVRPKPLQNFEYLEIVLCDPPTEPINLGGTLADTGVLHQ